MYDSIKEHTGIDISELDEDSLRKVCKDLHMEVDESMGKGKLVDELFGEKCEQDQYHLYVHNRQWRRCWGLSRPRY